MDDSIAVYKLKCEYYVCYNEFSLFFSKFFLLVMQIVTEITSLGIFSHKVELFYVLKAVPDVP